MTRSRCVQCLLVVLLFAWSWLFRYNDPEGGIGGLTDDHFFYLVRGWQILYGELPFRDFVDPGAPLTLAIAALVQVTLGRGTWSEIVFCVTALSAATALTYWLARRLTGSTTVALAAAVFQVALNTRLYNYPKVLIYALAIPLLWRYMEGPTRWRRLAIAGMTAVAFLMRHDHGAFVGLASAIALALTPALPVKARLREAVLYGALVLGLVSPYLVYLQVNGGAVEHFRAANSWAQRDRARAPLIVPPFALEPRPGEDPPEPDAPWWQRGAFVQLSRNYDPWLFYVLWSIPLAALATLATPFGAGRRAAPLVQRKVALVAALAIVLNVGFLRGHLAVRFGDVAVPQAVLVAWLCVAWLDLVRSRVALPIRAAVASAALGVAIVTALMLASPFRERRELAGMTERPGYPFERSALITSRLQQLWPLENWTSPEEEGSIRLAFYLRDCTADADRVFISQYLPHVPALAQRAFAGGHADLRPSFFVTPGDQRRTIARLERQSVPIVIVPAGEEYEGFRKDFPRIDAYLAGRYEVAGDVDLGRDLVVRILTDRQRPPLREYAPFGTPCFR